MKIPDKIYIPFYPNDDGIDTHLGDDWFDSKDVDQYVGGWKEYIRKDALIEWLSKCKNNPTITDLQKDNIQELIDKIDSI